MIDLQPFCSTDKGRPTIAKSFSRGDFTYATNGHILVRVARRAYVAETESPNPEDLIAKHTTEAYQPLPKIVLPEATKTTCEYCGGSGIEHDCPDCTCECERCDGGYVSGDKYRTVGIGNAVFAAKYFRLLKKLEAEIASDPSDFEPMPFKFSDGIGLLMPMRGEGVEHFTAPAPTEGMQ